jgi:hypothetical protein
VGRFLDRIAHAWNAFQSPQRDPTETSYGAATYTHFPDRTRTRVGNERSIVASIQTRIAIDVSAIDVRHVRLDDNGRFSEEIKSGLNNCLTVEANIDQAARAFRQDIVLSMFDQGCIAIVPVDTTLNPAVSGSYDIQTMRVGEIVNWFPYKIKVNLFNVDKGVREQIMVDKSYAAVVENPLYMVMNEPSSTLQRIIRKLNLLDAVDEQSASGKLDLLIQLPYTIKSEERRRQADQRTKDIEFQLKGSKYGIAYTDATEKVIQLNRPAENNLLNQVQYLLAMLYGQLGITEEIMNGTADEAAMINYYNRTIEPILAAIVEAMRRTFLTKTARSQGQSIMYFRDLFKFVTLKDFAEISDKLTRNEVASSNDLRQVIGWRPSKDPRADELRNSNMPAPSEPALQLVRGGNSQNDSS